MIDDLILNLLRQPSISPDDHGCQALLTKRLEALGFKIQSIPFGDVTNLWASIGKEGPCLVFAGHTDVVPPGPVESWTYDPFTPTVTDGKLYARGAADMKVALCCMVIACEQFIKAHPNFPGRIGFLITSAEELTTDDGTKKTIDTLINNQQEKIDYCIVGEASSNKHLGDRVRIGRRGSLSGKLSVHGKQGHIAYPEPNQNPIHLAAPILEKLCNTKWDQGNEFFEPTSFQISNIHAGTGANNVIPGECIIDFNFRYSNESTAESLMKRVENSVNQYGTPTTIDWSPSGEPFISKQGKLFDAVSQSIKTMTGTTPQADTGGGTSDARFIAPYGIETIELGFVGETIHQVDEHIAIADIEKLTKCYENILKHIF